MIKIRNSDDENYIIDICSEKIDSFSAKLLRKILLNLMNSGKFCLYINFTTVKSVNPEILGIIMAANRTCTSKGGKVSIFGLNSDVLLIFHVVQLDKYINLYTNEHDALKNSNLLGKRRLRLVK